MSDKKTAKLKDKHWKALQLIESCEMTLKQISKEVGISYDVMCDLNEGNSDKLGSVATLFHAEVELITKKLVKKARDLSKSNMALSQDLIQRILNDIKSKKTLQLEDKKLVGTLTNCIARSQPSVSIGSLTYNYTKGLSAEELIHEYTRLRTIASGASQRGAVQTALAGGSRVLPSPDERGSELQEESEGS
jgi:hypothetical protein